MLHYDLMDHLSLLYPQFWITLIFLRKILVKRGFNAGSKRRCNTTRIKWWRLDSIFSFPPYPHKYHFLLSHYTIIYLKSTNSLGWIAFFSLLCVYSRKLKKSYPPFSLNFIFSNTSTLAVYYNKPFQIL